jgi:hypothetical protein
MFHSVALRSILRRVRNATLPFAPDPGKRRTSAASVEM